MSAMTEHLDTMVVEAATPDETAYARLRGRSDVSVWFAPGYYPYATDARVADKLVQLGRLLWVARMKEYYRFKSVQLGRTVRGEGMPKTPAQVARREARDNIVASGRSDDGTVELTAVGLLTWSVTLAPGSVERVAEDAFCAACGQAGERLVLDHLDKLAFVWAQRY